MDHHPILLLSDVLRSLERRSMNEIIKNIYQLYKKNSMECFAIIAKTYYERMKWTEAHIV